MTAASDQGGAAGPRVPIDEQIAALKRLTDARANYLESRISAGKITAVAAEREILALDEALKSLNVVRKYLDEFRDFLQVKLDFEARRRRELAGEDDGAAEPGADGGGPDR